MHINQLYQYYLQYPNIQTDSRKIQHGDIYFALKGPSFNGNHFAEEALKNGAAFAIVDEVFDHENVNERIIKVDNVLETLQQLAKHHRMQFMHVPFIAITGSNGKTTTKELVHEVLSTTYKTYTTVGNLNNHIGVPLTILKIRNDVEMAVIEMGANHQKEIEHYCSYALPNYGLITNIGKAHLEGFGGIEGVKKGKGELFDCLRKCKGTAFVNNDDEGIVEMSKGIAATISYGEKDADICGHVVNSQDLLSVAIEKDNVLEIIDTQLVGAYNLQNILAAVCIGKYFKIESEKIKNALESYSPSNSRSELIERNGNKIILDAYNANPSSMKAAIENFAKMDGTEKILLLGAMVELGTESIHEHAQIIELIKKYDWKYVVLTGGDYQKIDHPFLSFNNASEVKKWLQAQNFSGVNMLIKGSRSMQMEKVIE